MADGYIRTRGGGVERMKEDAHILDEAIRDSGRDISAVGFAQLQNAFVWEDGDAWEVVRKGVASHIGVYGGWAQGSDTPGREFFISPPDEATLRHITPAGPPREILHALRPMVEAFAGRSEFHLVIRLHYPGMDFDTSARAVELFAEKVLPALKGS
jgi:hypothetical protein